MSNNQILNDVRIFVYIVEQGSLIKAGEILNIPLPTISRRLVALEENFKKKLMFRDNRTIKLTPFGEDLYKTCSEYIKNLDLELSKLITLGSEMSGSIKISAPRTLFYHFVHDKLLEFQNENPEVMFDITLSSQISMNKFGQCDLIITKDIDNFRDLTSKPFCETPFVLCASPSYKISDLSCPENLLSEHIKCITVKGYEKWSFVNANASDFKSINPFSYISTDEYNLAKYYAIGGKGIALLPRPFIEKDISVGKLCSLDIIGWKPKNITHYLLYAHFRDIPLKCKELIKFLTQNGTIKF